ncbi:MAG: hypothetical protein U0228_33180 [Myxococcaceae bacterium]
MIAAPVGARCPTHHELALGACARCGTFFCALCPAPHCSTPRDLVLERRIANLALGAWGLPLSTVILCIVPFANMLVLPVVVAGLVCGLRARTLAAQANLATPPGAIVGIVLNAIFLFLMVLGVGMVLSGFPE